MDTNPLEKRTDVSEAERHLSSVDAILEPDVLLRLREFVAAAEDAVKQQRVREAIALLSQHYRGLANMINLVRHWLGEQQADPLIMDHFKHLASAQFEPRRADSIFGEQHGTAPAWLQHMIQDPSWRSILYQLSEAHPHCLLLNFVIKKIGETQRGAQTEVAAAVGSAAAHWDVFYDVFLRSLQSLSLNDISRLCTPFQHTYLTAQLVLRSLSLRPRTGLIFRGLARNLSQSVQSQQHLTQPLDLLLSSAPKYPALYRSLSSFARSNRWLPIDLERVYALYRDASDPPPVHLLRDPALLEYLLDSVFVSNSWSHSAQSQAIYLLAYACSVNDDRTFYRLELDVSAMDRSDMLDTVVDKSQMQQCTRALQTAVNICQDRAKLLNLAGYEIGLRNVVEVPVVALGVLSWIRSQLLDRDYYSATYQKQATPVMLRLLAQIASLHALQRVNVLDTLVEAFDLHTTELDDLAVVALRKQILQVLVHLMHCGLVEPVLSMVLGHVPRMDHALVRFFVVTILESTKGPYSAAFAQGIFQIAELPAGMLAIRHEQSSLQAMKEFANFLIEANDTPPAILKQASLWTAGEN